MGASCRVGATSQSYTRPECHTPGLTPTCYGLQLEGFLEEETFVLGLRGWIEF